MDGDKYVIKGKVEEFEGGIKPGLSLPKHTEENLPKDNGTLINKPENSTNVKDLIRK